MGGYVKIPIKICNTFDLMRDLWVTYSQKTLVDLSCLHTTLPVWFFGIWRLFTSCQVHKPHSTGKYTNTNTQTHTFYVSNFTPTQLGLFGLLCNKLVGPEGAKSKPTKRVYIIISPEQNTSDVFTYLPAICWFGPLSWIFIMAWEREESGFTPLIPCVRSSVPCEITFWWKREDNFIFLYQMNLFLESKYLY